jgi:CRP-like cAMP-binding protein
VSSSLNFQQNQLLAVLPVSELERILPELEYVSLEFKQVLHEVNEPIQYVYFPLCGICSMLKVMEDGSSIEVGTVGNEGFVGLPILLGTSHLPTESIIQIPGDAARMSASAFTRVITPGSPLYMILLRYTQALFNQVAQSVACNRVHSVEERFCRWILITHDRVGKDEFPLTQEFMGQMLGVRRASVSLAASTFQKAGFIQYSRGRMTIVDRQGIESTCCECYGIIKAEFDRLIGSDRG